MEKEVYEQKLNEIENECSQKKTKLMVDYGLSQKKFDVGDIITNNIYTIKVDKITVYKSFGLPMPVYHGVELTKELVPKKNKNRGAIYSNDNVTKLNAK